MTPTTDATSGAAADPVARVDHLVVMAASLDEGVAWCEATLGVVPGPGGEHPFMGTHNRLLRIATVDFPRAYLEIIAINPLATHALPESSRRWFDMDDEALRERIAARGPRLVHFVASVPDITASLTALTAQGIDRGAAISASRMTPTGLLQWQISIRDDGQRLFDGTLPTLIEWGEVHPSRAMPDSGVVLQSLVTTHPHSAALQAAYDAIGLRSVTTSTGPANLTATLLTPRGRISLDSMDNRP